MATMNDFRFLDWQLPTTDADPLILTYQGPDGEQSLRFPTARQDPQIAAWIDRFEREGKDPYPDSHRDRWCRAYLAWTTGRAIGLLDVIEVRGQVYQDFFELPGGRFDHREFGI